MKFFSGASSRHPLSSCAGLLSTILLGSSAVHALQIQVDDASMSKTYYPIMAERKNFVDQDFSVE